MIDVRTPEIDPGADALGLDDGVQLAGACQELLLPGALSDADDDVGVTVHLHVRMIRRHIGKESAGVVGVDHLIHVAVVHVVGVIETGEGDAAAEDVGPAEHEVACMVCAHGKAGDEDPVVPAGDLVDARHQLVAHVAVPGFVTAHAVIGVPVHIGHGLLVDSVKGEEADAALVQIVAQGVEHAEAFPVEEPAVLAGDCEQRDAAPAVGLEFHVPAQFVAVLFVVLNIHSQIPS